jgi:polyhydroxybutyrate depolymerase
VIRDGRRAAMLVAFCAVALVAVALPSAGMAGAGATNAASGACSLAPTGGDVLRSAAGRNYYLHVPPGLAAPAPLMISLHGLGQGARLHALDTGWSAVADAQGFIVAYPQGSGAPPGWNFAQHSVDVQFVLAVVADIEASWCVDVRHVHATGHSNGAIMALRLACDAADVFASVAEYAGGPPDVTGSPCQPSRPISVGVFSSALDPLSLLVFGYFTRNAWLARNQCPTAPAREPGVLLEASRYAPCAAGTEVIWRAYLLQSHNWPAGADRADIQRRMLDLFRANPLPA